MKYIQGFNELRAIAVLAVMFYHLGWSQFGYGWAGVPFFFVISGFLITGILLDNKDSEPRSFFYTFYARRCLRIFPLYYLYLIVIAIWCAALSVKTSGWTYFILYLQNYYLAANEFHLVPGMELGHTWTLAVEEQFYMIWPLLIFFVGKRYIKPLIFVLVTASVISRFWIGENTTYVPFAPLTSNLDTLCLGALLAIIYRERKSAMAWVSWGALVSGIAFITYQAQGSQLSLNGSNSWFQLGLALLFTGIVGLVATDKKFTIQWPLLAYIGKISYGLYIWHGFTFHVVSAATYHNWIPTYSAPTADAIRLTLTFAATMICYHFFELPILKLKDKLTYGKKPKINLNLPPLDPLKSPIAGSA